MTAKTATATAKTKAEATAKTKAEATATTVGVDRQRDTMHLNILKLNFYKPRKKPRTLVTHEGAPAKLLTAEQMLRRSVLSCLLWESEFYEDGPEIAARIRRLVVDVAPEQVAAYGLAILLKEIAEKVTIYTFSEKPKRVAPRRGMAGVDACGWF